MSPTMLKIFNVLSVGFKRHPLLINSLVYGSLYVGAEYSQQFLTKKVLLVQKPAIEERVEEIDYRTLGRYAVMGTFIYAPTLHLWYKWLDGRFPGTTRKVIVKKLLLDQFLLTPYLLIIFYTGMAIMEGADDKFEELFEKFVPTFERSCIFWLPAQLGNFALIPPKLRVIYMGICGFIWINILCWTKRQQLPKTVEK